MKFDYQLFINLWKTEPEKREIVRNYELFIGPLGEKPLEKEFWYKQLVEPFEKFENYLIPPHISKDDYDWGLLAQLCAASLSSQINLKPDEDGVHMMITVENNSQVVTKDVNELFEFQVFRLYQIWIDENINLSVLCESDENEKIAVFNAKNNEFTIWKNMLKKIKPKKKNI